MIFRGPHPDVAIPDTPLMPFLLRQAGRLADKPALIDATDGRSYTYGQLADAVARVAAGLDARGLGKGDVFAIYSPGALEYVVALLAVWSRGAASLTINPLFTAGELAYQLRDTGARFVLTLPELLGKVSEAARDTRVREVFTLGEAPGATPFAALLDGAGRAPGAAVREAAVDPRADVAVLLYSSGTTGFPKGVMLTHHNLVANVCQAQPLMRCAEDDVLIVAVPFFHIAAWVILFHMGLYNGGTTVILPRFDLERFLRTVQDYRVTRTLLVPPIVVALAKQPVVARYDLSSLRTIVVGAAPLAESVGRACAERAGCTVLQAYGLSETSPLTHMAPEVPGAINVASVGVPLPNTECKVVDPATGAELGRHQPGELWVRGPQVMRGYLNRPEATAEAIDASGWLRTGDVGYADDAGEFYIVDRVKELIKYKGYQVAPAELEAVLLSHPAVADVAVIPSPDEEAGEVPKAFVVLKGPATAEELMAYVAERVAPHKKIRRLAFIDEVPKTASGKILRRVLIERERAAVGGDGGGTAGDR